MVPIYAVESWLALRFNQQKVYLETAREAYEAYVVYSLYKLMREFLGDKPRVRCPSCVRLARWRCMHGCSLKQHADSYETRVYRG
jgi:hypothetical protein